MIQPRLTPNELRVAMRAGVLTTQVRAHVPSRALSSFFGSIGSWFSSVRFGGVPFVRGGATAKAPVNAVQGATGQTVSPSSALTLSAVWACSWLNARTLASLPFDLKRYDVSGRATLETENPLYDVLRWQPNADMEALIFWTAIWISEQMWGTGYAQIKRSAGRVVALEFLLPQYVTTYQDDKKRIRYAYDDPYDTRDLAAADVFRVFTRTLDGLTGASVIEFARNSLGLAQSGELVASKTFKRGLNASGYLTKDKFLTPEQRAQIRTSLDEFTGDSDSAGGTMVLEGGFSYNQLSLKPLDAELLASRQFSVEDVCRWFGVPPILIGHAAEGQTMWGSGIEQIFGGWARLSLRPYLTAASQAVRSKLVLPQDRPFLFAEFDLDDLLAADSQARAALYASLGQNGVMTRNEMREREGLSKMDGGDTLTVQSNLVPLDQLGNGTAAGGGSPASEKARNALREFLGMLETDAQKAREVKT